MIADYINLRLLKLRVTALGKQLLWKLHITALHHSLFITKSSKFWFYFVVNQISTPQNHLSNFSDRLVQLSLNSHSHKSDLMRVIEYYDRMVVNVSILFFFSLFKLILAQIVSTFDGSSFIQTHTIFPKL